MNCTNLKRLLKLRNEYALKIKKSVFLFQGKEQIYAVGECASIVSDIIKVQKFKKDNIDYCTFPSYSSLIFIPKIEANGYTCAVVDSLTKKMKEELNDE